MKTNALNPAAGGGGGTTGFRYMTDSSSPYPDHTVNVIPDGSLQVGAVQGGQAGHTPEPVVQEVPDVRIQPVHQGEAVVLPRIVLQDFCIYFKDVLWR